LNEFAQEQGFDPLVAQNWYSKTRDFMQSDEVTQIHKVFPLPRPLLFPLPSYFPHPFPLLPSSFLFPLHSSLFTLHSSLFTLHYSIYTLHSSLFTLHSSLFTLHSSLFTLHSSLFTLHSSLFTLHSSLFITLHTSFFPLRSSSSLHSSFTLPLFTLPHEIIYIFLIENENNFGTLQRKLHESTETCLS
jgi:hypothetical protein